MIHSRQQARKLFLTLIGIELMLVVAYGTDAWVQGTTEQLHAVIDLDGEGNLPAWFSSFQLSLIAISFWALAVRFRTTRRPSRRFLQTCGGFFLLLSIDETALLHERITEALGSRYIDWVPAYLASHPGESCICVLVLIMCVAAVFPHFRGLWRVSPGASLIGAAGCVVYVMGAAVLETIGYRMIGAGVSLATYRFEVAAEEFLEMLGASLILYAVLLFCVSRGKRPSALERGSVPLSISLRSLSEVVSADKGRVVSCG